MFGFEKPHRFYNKQVKYSKLNQWMTVYTHKSQIWDKKRIQQSKNKKDIQNNW